MYNLLISGAAGLILLLLLKFAANLPLWGAFPLGLLVFVGCFYLISRLIMKKVMAIMEAATKDLQANPPRIDKGIKTLQTAMKYGPWQIYVTGQLNAQIGMIYYMKRDFANAFPYLEKAFFKNWVAMASFDTSGDQKRSPEGLAAAEKGVFKKYYTVQKGDTLTSVSKKFNVSTSILQAWNNLKGRLALKPGKRIVVAKFVEKQGAMVAADEKS